MSTYIVLGTGIGIAVLMALASLIQAAREERRRNERESQEGHQ